MTEMQSVREREGEMSAERVRDEQIYSIKVERKRDGQSKGGKGRECKVCWDCCVRAGSAFIILSVDFKG